MTSLGITLATAALQISFAALVAAALVIGAGRRSPRTAAALAAAGLGFCCLLTVVAVAPLPDWWTWDAVAATGPRAAIAAEIQHLPAATSTADGAFIPIRRLVALLPSSGSVVPSTGWHWNAWAVVAVLFFAGLSFEFCRLAWAVAAVGKIRRRSDVVNDPILVAEVDELRRTLNIRSHVVLRQSSEVGTAATVGWRRPVILLATDWTTWSVAERRAVLAHELAHVRRCDYFLGLLVLIGRAVHFYHPLVRWLAGRVRLHQELAADAIAAAVAGGRSDYLRALARMALRQDAALVAGAARPFLSDRGSLLRRVAMLRVTDDGRPLGRMARWGMAGLLVAATFAVSAVRGPAQTPADAKPAGGPAGGQLPPIDLSYVPPNAVGFVAIRPAALLGRPEMKPIADEWQRLFRAACKSAGLGPSFDIPFDAVEQIVGPFEIKTLSEEERKKNPQGEGHAVMMGLSMIRMTRDFDWPATLKATSPLATVTEIKPGVFECRCPLFGPQPATARVVDRRTLALTLPSGQVPGRSEDNGARWGAALKTVEGAWFVQVYDNAGGRWTESLTKDSKLAARLGGLGRPAHLALGVSGDETVRVSLAADYAAEQSGADVRRVSEAFRDFLRSEFDGKPKPTGGADRVLHDLADEFLRTLQVRASGKLVTAEAGLSKNWADVLRAITPGSDGGLKPAVEVREEKP
jgi:beta-lactamase regulating signal transducer with metallopeptidase domain